MRPPQFRTQFDPAHGMAVPVAAGVLRITAPNAGPFTFHGTNTYLVGDRSVALIDPGPENEEHFRTLMAAIGGRDVSHILVTHTHADHSPLARRMSRETGAPVLAEGPHRAARDLRAGEINPLDAAADRDFEPDITLAQGDMIDGENWRMEAVHTPGHTANHMAFALIGEDILFSGDHVMAWATSIIAPPDGAMADYMRSLDALLDRNDRLYLPGHGGMLESPREFVRGLKAHRKMREAAILARIRAGDTEIPGIVARIYKDTDPRLHDAAALSVLAHMEDLVDKGKLVCDGPVSLSASFSLA